MLQSSRKRIQEIQDRVAEISVANRTHGALFLAVHENSNQATSKCQNRHLFICFPDSQVLKALLPGPLFKAS